MRLAGSVTLSALWLLLLVAYSAPLWVSMYGSWDVWVDGDPAARSQAVVLLAVLLVIPPVVLGFVTRWWLRRGRA